MIIIKFYIFYAYIQLLQTLLL